MTHGGQEGMNEKRIRMMTKLADFEQRNREDLYRAGNYYRSDYIGIQLLKNLLRITLAYFIGAVLWACCHMDGLMKKLNTMDVRGTGMKLLIFYGVTAALFLLLTYLICTVRFYRSEKKLQIYRNMLEHLLLEYDREEPEESRSSRREHRKQGGRDNDSTVEL